mmetsp:Transcript_13982/g.20727  ORF Transcript_13982/g.20727 Transcript_13982/m.20727 type:complete len:81 (+) Transcript_13982:1158-1400(+)
MKDIIHVKYNQSILPADAFVDEESSSKSRPHKQMHALDNIHNSALHAVFDAVAVVAASVHAHNANSPTSHSLMSNHAGHD